MSKRTGQAVSYLLRAHTDAQQAVLLCSASLRRHKLALRGGACSRSSLLAVTLHASKLGALRRKLAFEATARQHVSKVTKGAAKRGRLAADVGTAEVRVRSPSLPPCVPHATTRKLVLVTTRQRQTSCVIAQDSFESSVP